MILRQHSCRPSRRALVMAAAAALALALLMPTGPARAGAPVAVAPRHADA